MQDLQCTTSVFLMRWGRSRVGWLTRQSSFLPFMFRRGCRENWDDTRPPSPVLFCDWPGRSVSHERVGGGWAVERQMAATRNAWPSSKTTGSNKEMGDAEWGNHKTRSPLNNISTNQHPTLKGVVNDAKLQYL